MAPTPLRLVHTLAKIPGVGGLLDRSPLAGMRALLGFHALVRRIQNSDKVYVAAINGLALGGGFELALACDIRIAGDGPYEMGLMEIAFGLPPGGGGSQLLARALGSARTVELLLEGRLLSPKEAAEAGIVHRVVDRDAVDEEALEVADRLARRAPGSVRAVKQAVYDAGSARLGRGMAMERARFLALASRRSTQGVLRGYLEDVRTYQRTKRGGAAGFAADRLPDWQTGAAAPEAATR
jgi:enoyl-CoA hydratase